MGNIGKIDSCYGCGVCAMACGKRLIQMKLSPEGFYIPYITDQKACTDCGLCKSVCTYQHSSLSVDNKPLLTVAAWSKSESVRQASSSGGVCYEFEKTMLEQNFKSCLVRYNPNNHRAEHYVAHSIGDLKEGLGSKYIQSYTFDAFLSLSKDEKYLVVGTPCQIDSFRRFMTKMKREDNYVLVDFFCHGVPSMLMWKKYEDYVETKIGRLSYVSWRNKQTGWHDSWAMAIDGECQCASGNESFSHDYFSRRSQGDSFYAMFLGDMCFNKPCYTHCKFKYDQSAADVRVGDLWGNTYAKDEKGVSAVVAFTQKGIDLIKQSNIEYVEHPFFVVAEGQQKRRVAYRENIVRRVMEALKDDSITIVDVVNLQKRLEKRALMIKRITHPIDSFCNLLKKF